MNQCRIWKYFTIHWIYLGECLDQWIAFYHIGYHLNSLEEKNVMLYIWKTGRLQNCAAKLPPFCKVVFLTSSAIAGDVFQKNFNGCVRDLIPLQELLSSQSYEMDLRSSWICISRGPLPFGPLLIRRIRQPFCLFRSSRTPFPQDQEWWSSSLSIC